MDYLLSIVNIVGVIAVVVFIPFLVYRSISYFSKQNRCLREIKESVQKIENMLVDK